MISFLLNSLRNAIRDYRQPTSGTRQGQTSTTTDKTTSMATAFTALLTSTVIILSFASIFAKSDQKIANNRELAEDRNMAEDHRQQDQDFGAGQAQTNRARDKEKSTTASFTALLTLAAVMLSFTSVLVNSDQKITDSRQLVEKGLPHFSHIITLLSSASTLFILALISIISTFAVIIITFFVAFRCERGFESALFHALRKSCLLRTLRRKCPLTVYSLLSVLVAICTVLTFSHIMGRASLQAAVLLPGNVPQREPAGN